MKRIIFEHKESDTVYFDQLKEPNLIMVKKKDKILGAILRCDDYYVNTYNDGQSAGFHVLSKAVSNFKLSFIDSEFYLID